MIRTKAVVRCATACISTQQRGGLSDQAARLRANSVYLQTLGALEVPGNPQDLGQLLTSLLFCAYKVLGIESQQTTGYGLHFSLSLGTGNMWGGVIGVEGVKLVETNQHWATCATYQPFLSK